VCSYRYPLSAIIFKFNLIAVRLAEVEILGDLLLLYHTEPSVAF